ncbi:hypothetical protein TraAM80_05633 [Trypanosoma rangeli]|uniref:Uncharacterized protein n=1 Tax=Trypanosoma rangeli TaxID=5698 RepID=A0A422NE73_TRYRA|nr:uncharacterized protein TraAM80_05633 [Trypanosoma rangeli]RNF03787.1 hypothetical protein TraAM80_05633 [Trypanosoma rangeli]|eukprot:RNF03787.1 hypothetical protein TraAM80_05633 [Trypanosoma rangeli]
MYGDEYHHNRCYRGVFVEPPPKRQEMLVYCLFVKPGPEDVFSVVGALPVLDVLAQLKDEAQRRGRFTWLLKLHTSAAPLLLDPNTIHSLVFQYGLTKTWPSHLYVLLFAAAVEGGVLGR